MSVTVSLPAELGIRAQEAAARQGWKLEEYVITAVELALERLSLDEIFAPVRKQFAETGLTEEELTVLVKEERQAMWEEKHLEVRTRGVMPETLVNLWLLDRLQDAKAG